MIATSKTAPRTPPTMTPMGVPDLLPLTTLDLWSLALFELELVTPVGRVALSPLLAGQPVFGLAVALALALALAAVEIEGGSS
jgi:hypothetical protein